MAKLKMLKLPRKPKKTASITVKEKFLAKIEAIKKENQRRKELNNYADRLDAKISGISGAVVLPNRFRTAVIKKRKKAGSRKKTARKKTGRKRKR